ncbi:hypothetical protein [Moraxella marmotae]|uniref:hypothetical protein n=1 Tax=Moraxella marmotae TaxID=3344520 RepID=UPI0035F32680
MTQQVLTSNAFTVGEPVMIEGRLGTHTKHFNDPESGQVVVNYTIIVADKVQRLSAQDSEVLTEKIHQQSVPDEPMPKEKQLINTPSDEQKTGQTAGETGGKTADKVADTTANQHSKPTPKAPKTDAADRPKNCWEFVQTHMADQDNEDKQGEF